MILFSILFATAILFSQISHWGWFELLRSEPMAISTLLETAVSFSALLVLAQPQHRSRLSFLCVFLIANTLWFLPEVPNHRLLLSAIAAAYLISRVTIPSKPEADGSFLSVLRALLIVLYFFAVFHKINAQFLDSETSCAVIFLGHIAPSIQTWSIGSVPVFAHFAIWGSLLLEAFLVVGLSYVPLRKYAVMLALVFHALLSFDMEMHFLDFSAAMYCGLYAFLSPRSNEVFEQRLAHVLAVAFVLLIAFALLFGASDNGYAIFSICRQATWFVYAAVLFVFYARSPAASRRLSDSTQGECASPCLASRFAWIPRGANWVLLSLFILNGVSPYLGVKTRTAFSMYSNVQVTEAWSNHYLVSRSLDLAGLLQDRVRIIAPDSLPAVRMKAELPYPSFERLLERFGEQYRETGITYEYGGKRYSYPADPMPKKSSWLVKKVTWFKPIRAEGPTDCVW